MPIDEKGGRDGPGVRAPTPDIALDDRLGFVGTAGSGHVKSRASGPTATPRACAVCGEIFAPHRRRPEARFCSLRCVWVATKGPEYNARIAIDSAEFRGDVQRGRGDGKSYRKLNGRHEHRVAAEKKLGRPLKAGEIVHHKDEAIQNNISSNLDVLGSQAEHARLHFRGKKQTPDHIKKRIEARMKTIRERKRAL
jgi:hypothetical protein